MSLHIPASLMIFVLLLIVLVVAIVSLWRTLAALHGTARCNTSLPQPVPAAEPPSGTLGKMISLSKSATTATGSVNCLSFLCLVCALDVCICLNF